MNIKAWKSLFERILSSAFALWTNADLYILLPALTYILPHFLTDLLTHSLQQRVGRILNFDVRTLKFGMKHPWMQLLIFRKNQSGGP